MATPQIGIVGLKALQNDLIKLTSDRGALNKAFTQAGMEAANPIAAATRSSLPLDTGRLSGDVRVSATKSGASVHMGRPAIPYAGWIEFGGHRMAPHESSRDYHPRGRFLFPNAAQLASTGLNLYIAALSKSLDNFPWTNAQATEGTVHD